MIIDCHTHLNEYTEDPTGTLESRRDRLLDEMRRNGIAHAIVITSYKVNDKRPSLEEVLRVVGTHRRLGVVAGVNVCGDLDGQLDLLRRLLPDARLKGLKLYPGYEPFRVDDPRLEPLYRLAAEARLPVMIHTGDTFDPHARVEYAHPLDVDRIAVVHRDVNFVICHLGNPWFIDAMAVIYKNDNVFADISGFTVGAFADRYERYMIRKTDDAIAYINDPDKLMFGTDWPVSDIPSYLRFVERLELTAVEREGLLWRNAARVFGIEPEALDAAGD